MSLLIPVSEINTNENHRFSSFDFSSPWAQAFPIPYFGSLVEAKEFYSLQSDPTVVDIEKYQDAIIAMLWSQFFSGCCDSYTTDDLKQVAQGYSWDVAAILYSRAHPDFTAQTYYPLLTLDMENYKSKFNSSSGLAVSSAKGQDILDLITAITGLMEFQGAVTEVAVDSIDRLITKYGLSITPKSPWWAAIHQDSFVSGVVPVEYRGATDAILFAANAAAQRISECEQGKTFNSKISKPAVAPGGSKTITLGFLKGSPKVKLENNAFSRRTTISHPVIEESGYKHTASYLAPLISYLKELQLNPQYSSQRHQLSYYKIDARETLQELQSIVSNNSIHGVDYYDLGLSITELWLDKFNPFTPFEFVVHDLQGEASDYEKNGAFYPVCIGGYATDVSAVRYLNETVKHIDAAMAEIKELQDPVLPGSPKTVSTDKNDNWWMILAIVLIVALVLIVIVLK